MRRTWAIVLAAGDGTRVAELTLDSSGRPVPKQYCAFGTGRTLLDRALARAERLVPRSRVAIVVAEQHRVWWEGALAGWPADSVIVQPCNRGTAAGLLLGLLHVLRRDSHARLLVFPSDHHVEREDVLHASWLSALDGLQHAADRVVLLGMTPRAADAEYGWILCGSPGAGGLRGVVSFREKPKAATAARLRKRGALLNTFMLATASAPLLSAYAAAVPRLLRSLAVAVRCGSATTLSTLYDGVATCDFSREILERSTDRLAAAVVPSCGWSDLGTPGRLNAFLNSRQAESRPFVSGTAARVGIGPRPGGPSR
jgi:mannose-1-phosphate guanylyltransferase